MPLSTNPELADGPAPSQGIRHTPGPWDQDGSWVFKPLAEVARDGATIELIAISEIGNEAVRAANARLIAAAPELLAALQKTLDSLEVARSLINVETHPIHESMAFDASNKAKAAIAKALGE